jgi:hypothetical protein
MAAGGMYVGLDAAPIHPFDLHTTPRLFGGLLSCSYPI